MQALFEDTRVLTSTAGGAVILNADSWYEHVYLPLFDPVVLSLVYRSLPPALPTNLPPLCSLDAKGIHTYNSACI